MSKGILAQSTPRLHPVLKVALKSLDVNLEAELKRYRRYKAEEQLPLQHGPQASYQNGKGPEGVSVMAGSARCATLPNRWLSTAQSDRDRAPNRLAVRPEMNQENREQPVVSAVLPQGSGASLALTSATGSTSNREEAITELETEPNDYLESSEELLKSLGFPAEEVAVTSKNPDRERKNKLLTPLGIGSMLLLFMTGGTLWFVGKHPSVVRHLRTDSHLLVTSNPKEASKTTYPKAAEIAVSPQVDLNLDSLSTLPTSPSSSPRQVKSPAVSISPQVELTPPINTPVTPEPSVQIPAVVPIPRTSIGVDGLSTVRTDAAFEQYYYVVSPDRGEYSLEQIRKIIPDATVRDFPQGRKIQLGVFRAESNAKSLVSALAGQGIYAQIYNLSY